MSDKGMLYLIATPIGNLDDMTFRAVKTLEFVDYVLAEDTRHSIKLLNHFDISKKLVSYHEHNQYTKAQSIVNDLENGINVGLVTDAGTPGISDPGSYLVVLCQENDIPYTIIPGPVAFVNALILSGQNTNRLVFDGFLPMKKKERQKRLELLQTESRTIVFYEAPHKLKNTLNDLLKAFGPERSVSLVRELTKRFEEVIKLSLYDANEYYKEVDPRGEFVIVLEGIDEDILEEAKARKFDDISLESQMEQYIAQGLNKKEAIKQIAKDRGMNKRDVYSYFVEHA